MQQVLQKQDVDANKDKKIFRFYLAFFTYGITLE
jgi:hypothetical protein